MSESKLGGAPVGNHNSPATAFGAESALRNEN
jgi:hypothetical protein